ncbi:putative N-methylproline demethylase [compost metagenome]
MSSAAQPAKSFPHLFEPLEIRGKRLKNRIMSSGHDTSMPADNLVNEQLIAYHRARARGGVGLIVLQVAGVHDSARYTSHVLMATDDACIEGYRRLAEACHAEGTVVLSQVFHPGREIMESSDGLLTVAWSASASPNERFRVMPRALDQGMIDEIVAGYGAAARRLCAAGLDGVEIVASHGYLPAQFLNPRVNRREDGYNGDLDARLRFIREVILAVRANCPDDFIVGMRISADERDPEGLTEDESLAAALALQGQLDYVHLVAGTSASLGGAIHIVPPMAIEAAYLAPTAGSFKARLDIPLFVTGRINQPQEAEAILARGQADVCGMTRALICDPLMPNKAAAGRSDDVRACIACNQACIGHFHRGYPISCIQHPETGRELIYAQANPATVRKRVMVVGGGPAGMKAAAVAARRGHEVTLYEAGNQLGGQVLLAQLLPRRAEFGGAATNLQREMELAGVQVLRNVRVDRALVERERPDLVILATGARPYWPPFERGGELQVVDAWQVLREEVQPGRSVLVTDWRGDWIAPGIAERLARNGHQVRLAVNGTHCGENLPLYVRDQMAGELHKLGIQITPYARLYGCDDNTVYMMHSASGEPMLFEDVDTLVLCQGHQPVDDLGSALESLVEFRRIGDCLAPRTAEEAIYEGLKVAWDI